MRIYSLLFPLILLSAICHAQDSTLQWTWKGGNVSIAEYAIYGQPGIASIQNTPGPRYENGKWIDKSGKLWIFGGNSIDPLQNHLYLNDLWEYNPASGLWTWISGDSTGNVLPVFGIKGVPSNDNNPGSRAGSVCWTDTSGNFWMYGGSSTVENDLWKYNPSTLQWTWVSGDSISNSLPVYGKRGIPDIRNTPGFQYNSGSWVDNAGNLWLFGGDYTLNDLWRYNPSINEWTWMKGDTVLNIPGVYGIKGMADSANNPGARNNSACWTDTTGNLWLFGGYKDNGLRWSSGYYNDLWKYDLQSNNWIWINGDSLTDLQDQYGPIGVPSVSSIPGGTMRASAWCDNRGNFWIQGGLQYSTFRSSLWKYDPSSNLWTWVRSGPSSYGKQGTPNVNNNPGGRFASSAWVDPAGNLWLFGGSRSSTFANYGNISIGELYNDLWKYDVITGLWTWMKGGNSGDYPTLYGTKGIESALNNPGPRSESNAWTDASDNLWLFGSDATLNDLWKYDQASGNWTWIMGDTVHYAGIGSYGRKGIVNATNIPSMRSDGVSWKDNSGNFWLFGGLTAKPFYNMLNDLWMYNPSIGQWTWMTGDSLVDVPSVYGTKGIPASSNTPGSRINSVSWTDKSGNFWLFGGNGVSSGSQDHFLSDLWKYDPAGNEWTWVNGDSIPEITGIYGKQGVASANNRPGARYRSMSWTDSTGNFWLYGGQVADKSPFGLSYTDVNDLWKYDPLTNLWTWMKGDSTTYSSGSYMPVYGMYGQKGQPADSNTPGGREQGAIWVDKGGNLWLFGGLGQAASTENELSDVWEYNPFVNRWTWMYGDSVTDVLTNYGAQGISSSANTPGSRYPGVWWRDSKGNFWMYGGVAFPKSIRLDFDDLWRFIPSPSSKQDSIHRDTTVILPDLMRVAPNPFKNIIAITSSKTDSVSLIDVFNINGILLFRYSTLSSTTDIDLSRCPDGMYIIRAEDKRGKVIGKKLVIKQ